MSNKGARNAYLRKLHLPTIKEFCENCGYDFRFVNGFEWHVRIDNKMDVFPTRNRWHWLATDERGAFKDYEELQNIFMERLEL